MVVIKSEKLRKLMSTAIPLLLIPAAVIIGAAVFDDRKYVFISLAVTVLTLLLFISGYERRVTGTRRMVLAAVMTALASVGRLIPFFKPVTALTIISGIYLGAESGFLVGSLTAVISNFYFGQGPWTPFQMLALGLIGYAAGKAANPLKKHRPLLLGYGVISGVFYSFTMDIWTMLWYSGKFELSVYLGALATAVPYTVMYSVSNFIFLFFLHKPMGEKLERIRIKYGI